MKKKLCFVAAAIGLSATALVATPAQASGSSGTLAEILLSDSKWDDANGFDRNRWDFDIVTQAVLAFPALAEAASTPGANLTVFLPTDQAFRRLVRDLTGQTHLTEKQIFDTVVSLGLPTVEKVLQYHILAGAQIDYHTALQSDGAALTMLSGDTLTVDVRRHWVVVLQDNDPDFRDPRVIFPNIQGSNGIAHGIDRVLLPVNL
jgi:uncharacterized surface protein with fasciclin (FAS1) repeats